MSNKYTVKFNEAAAISTEANIVNKDGALGVVTFSVDDGITDTARNLARIAKDYNSARVSFVMPTNKLATLTTKRDEISGKLVYDFEDDGRYKYTQTEEQETYVKTWKDFIEAKEDWAELVSHTHTNGFWGYDDNGGVFTYVNNAKKVLTSAELPVGSVTAQFPAAKQLIEEIFGQKMVVFARPGIGLPFVPVTVDGTTYPSCYPPLKTAQYIAMENDSYIFTRTSSNPNFEDDLSKYVIYPSLFNGTKTSREYYSVGVTSDGNEARQVKDCIDIAISKGGWIIFTLHTVGISSPGYHNTTEEDMRAMFEYADSKGGELWVATLTEAAIYYSEWAKATVSSTYVNGKVNVTLTHTLDNNIYDMPLTVKVKVPETWECARLGEKNLEIHNENGSSYVYANILPNSGTAEISGF